MPLLLRTFVGIRAITRQDTGEGDATEEARGGKRTTHLRKGGGGSGNSHKSRPDDTRSVLSAGTRAVVGAAKRMATKVRAVFGRGRGLGGGGG